MKFNQSKKRPTGATSPLAWATALGAGLIATVAMLPQARGEMVYENDAAAPTPVGQSAQIEDRTAMRQALGTSEKVQVTLQTQQQATEAPASVQQAAATDTQNYSKTELMRRERQREELKNEDILQERLEELRLRDERRRTDQVLGKGGETPQAAQVAIQNNAPIKEEVIVAPVTEHPGMPSKASTNSSDSLMNSSSAAVSAQAEPVTSERTMFSISPHAGLSNMVNSGGYFDVHPHFGGGLAVSVGASDFVSFEAGWTYNEYGITMSSSNPFAIANQYRAASMGSSNFETVAMKQNVFDAGLKLHVLGSESRIRPFVGGGGSYQRSFINFNQQVLSQMNAALGRNISPDYQVSGFLGYLSTGLDVKVAKNISVGAEFKYYAVLSANENTDLSNYNNAMYPGAAGYYGGYAPGYYNPTAALTQDTSVAGSSLARNSFYSIMGTASFSF